MALVGRLFGRDELMGLRRVFDISEREAFGDALRSYFGTRGIDYELRGTQLLARRDRRLLGEFYLDTIARRCKGVARDEWAQMVTAHFDALLAEDDMAALERDALDFERVRARLRIRLYDVRTVDLSRGGQLAGYAVAGGLFAAMVYDQPRVIVPVPREHVERWGVAGSSVFEEAMDRVQAEGPLEGRAMSTPVGTTFYTGPSPYTASHLLFAGDYVDEPPHGLLLACPSEKALFVHPMRDGSVMDAVEPMISLAHGLYDDGPVGISTSLFWWRRGEMQEIVTSRNGDSFQLSPTDEFDAAVRDLARPS